MPFEWDAAKNEANIRGHGIDFADILYWSETLCTGGGAGAAKPPPHIFAGGRRGRVPFGRRAARQLKCNMCLPRTTITIKVPCCRRLKTVLSSAYVGAEYNTL